MLRPLRLEEKPGFYVEPKLRDEMLTCLTRTLLIDPKEARVIPFSETDLPKVGKRISEHPLHEAYVGKELRDHKDELYRKAPAGALVAELDEEVQPKKRPRQGSLFNSPLLRTQRVFTMPLEKLREFWSRY